MMHLTPRFDDLRFPKLAISLSPSFQKTSNRRRLDFCSRFFPVSGLTAFRCLALSPMGATQGIFRIIGRDFS